MLNKWASVFLVIALVSTMCGISAFGQSQSNSTTEFSRAEDSPAPPGNRNEAQPNDKLKADVATLLSKARAGKVTPAPKSQIQPSKSNNLSKKAKIAIVVGIVVVVTAIIIYKSFDFECNDRCVL
jgi:preprotein translocase subunit SecF